jgi:peptidoglycan-associated lipoprotein
MKMKFRSTPVVAALLLLGAGCSHRQIRTEQPQAARSPESKPVALSLVHFAFDSSDLGADARKTLDWDVQQLLREPKLRFQVQGYCDDRGSDSYNIALGKRRAASVSAYLEKAGVDPNRVSTISYGKSDPLDPAHNEKAYALNRRAAFALLGPAQSVAAR